jgi:hypothetical protein
MRRLIWLASFVLVSACGGSDGGDGALVATDAESDASREDAVHVDVSIDGATTDTHADAAGEAATDALVDAKVDSAPPPFDPATWAPSAKGLWIWYFDYTGLTPAEAATKAKSAGVGWVLIKSGQDASFWSTRYTAATLKEFTSRGMHVFAWPYVTPTDVPGSIDAIVKAIDVPGTDGIVLDVEGEFEGAHGPAAKALCQGIRAKRPKVWLGFTSYGWPQYHTTFPWAEFDMYCGDVWMPQVYWSDRGVSWSYGYDDAVAGTKKVGIKAPMWMIQSNDDIYKGGAPTTADLNAWFDKAGPKTSLWELPSSSAPSKLTQLPSLHWANP